MVYNTLYKLSVSNYFSHIENNEGPYNPVLQESEKLLGVCVQGRDAPANMVYFDQKKKARREEFAVRDKKL